MGEANKQVKPAGARPKPPAAGMGRKKGSLNKTTAAVKDAFRAVYADLQADTGREHGHFGDWAKENPTEFYKLYAKLLPVEFKGDVNVTTMAARIVEARENERARRGD